MRNETQQQGTVRVTSTTEELKWNAPGYPQ